MGTDAWKLTASVPITRPAQKVNPVQKIALNMRRTSGNICNYPGNNLTYAACSSLLKQNPHV
jgi:hypothetical protein